LSISSISQKSNKHFLNTLYYAEAVRITALQASSSFVKNSQLWNRPTSKLHHLQRKIVFSSLIRDQSLK